MPDQTTRAPYEQAMHQINEVSDQTNRITDNGRRPFDPVTTVAILGARSNLAIASALLAVADAVRAGHPDCVVCNGTGSCSACR